MCGFDMNKQLVVRLLVVGWVVSVSSETSQEFASEALRADPQVVKAAVQSLGQKANLNIQSSCQCHVLYVIKRTVS